MADAAGAQLAAHADLAGAHVVVTLVVEAVHAGVAVACADGRRGQDVGLVAAARAEGGPRHHVLRQVDFAAQVPKVSRSFECVHFCAQLLSASGAEGRAMPPLTVTLGRAPVSLWSW
jgi:hypothetical protein